MLNSPNHLLPPLELAILEKLNPRMSLSTVDKQQYTNLCKGYDGEEQIYHKLDSQLSKQYLILYDLLLRFNNTEFQIDILIIGSHTVYPLEIKNYTGDFYIKQNNWYAASSKSEIRNPLHQVKRSELLLRQFLNKKYHTFSIQPHLIFINPEFFLYHAPLNSKIVFPTQIKRFITTLNAITFQPSSSQKSLANFLSENQLTKSIHQRLPDYKYNNLKKGIICKKCRQYMTYLNPAKLICKSCDTYEAIDIAIKRSVIDFATLFPKKKITTNQIQDWCQIINSKKTIRRVLKKFLTPINKGRHTYYVFNDKRL